MEDFRNGRWRARIHPADLPEMEQRWTRAVRERAEFRGEYRVRFNDGLWHWIVAWGEPVFADGRFAGHRGLWIVVPPWQN